MSENKNFIIYAPSYREDSGGIIVLHKLCHLLNEMGCNAFLWPDQLGMRPTLRKKIRNYIRPKDYITVPEYNTPIAKKSDLNNESVVVYAETVLGNPLAAKNVIRWLLHKPGYHSGVVDYGSNELFFVFDDYCIEPGYDIDPNNKLFVLALNSAYNSEGVSSRAGSCYMMRKGVGRDLVHDTQGSIQVDNLTHEETAAVFKKTKYFYSYDEFTLYSQYAALCGCISIVIPEKFSNREEWIESHPISKFGIAYGMEDIQHAIDTQHEVSRYFENLEEESRQTVSRFIKVVQSEFFP